MKKRIRKKNGIAKALKHPAFRQRIKPGKDRAAEAAKKYRRDVLERYE